MTGEPFQNQEDATCDVCGAFGPTDWCVSYLGTPASFGRCEACHAQEAMPRYYFDAMVEGSHMAVRDFRSEYMAGTWRRITVYDGGRYLPAFELLERLLAEGAFEAAPPAPDSTER